MAIENSATFGAAFVLGVALHLSIFRQGEWNLESPRLVLGVIVLDSVIVAGLNYLLPTSYASMGAAAKDVGQISSLVLAGIYSSVLIYRAFFHRLNTFPGPFSARLSNFYATALSAKNFRLYTETQDLHKQYGDFVRLGPQELSVTDPRASAIVHAPTSPCPKGPFYDAMRPLTSLHMCRDKGEHARRRKTWDRGFTAKALKDYESRVNRYSDELMDVIKGRVGKPIDAAQWFNFYSFDVMGDLAFGKSFGMLKHGKPHQFVTSLHGFMKGIGLFYHLLWLPPIVNNIPIVNAEQKTFWEWVSGAVEERRRMTPDRPDVFSWVLDEFEAKENPSGQDRMDLIGDAYTIVVAGSDTTAATMTCLFFELAQHPESLKKLQAEVDAYHVTHEDMGYESTSLAKLPYLDAVINEALRLHPSVPSGVQRVTPPDGLQIGDTFIPGNTVLQIPTYAIHRDERNFADANSFVPERWTDRNAMVKNASNFVPFGAGRYNCIGKNLGLMELRRVVAQLVHTYDVALAPGQTAEQFYAAKRDTFTLSLDKLDLVFTERKKA